MTSISPGEVAPRPWNGWWPLGAGVAAVLGTSWVRFAGGAWSDAAGDYAPVLVAISLVLFWRERAAFSEMVPRVRSLPGWCLLLGGLALFLLGVRARLIPLEALSHVAIVAGALWLAGGAALLRRLRFPILFLFLSVPVPGFLLAAATGGLKDLATFATVEVLYRLGYPVARDGAVLVVGNYQLLVAEACAGMNSLISLSAAGLLFLHLLPPDRPWKVAVTALSLVPIAVLANVGRIVLLILVTYHLGDEAGQGFLHGFAGMFMFALALGLFFLLTGLLGRRAAPLVGVANA